MTSHIRLAALAAIGATAVLAGCGRPPHPPVSSARIPAGQYRAVLTLPGGELPFGLAVVDEAGGKVAYLRNGAEAVRVTEIEERGGTLVLRLPGYLNRIEAAADATGYSGVAVMVRRGGREVRLPFRAVAGEQYRFYKAPLPNPPNVAGRWAVTLTGPDGVASPAVAELEQGGSRVVGTVMEPDGDHRFLEGEVRGDELWLSRFDGGSAFLYHARIGTDGSLSGTFWSGNWSTNALAAHRDETATLTDPAAEAAAVAPPPPLAFSFPDLDGRQVTLADARFHGKVVIVSIGGSWCPNCHDEAAFLVPLYGRLHAAGLEIIYLQFEHFGDFAQAVAANRRFVAASGIEWPVLIAGISDRDDATRKLPGLGRVFAFPTTLVLDRTGSIRKVHSGFAGPATGQHYDDLKREFTTLVESLLATHG